jgi:hypothetical protein
MLIEVFPEVGTAGKVVSTASTVFYMPDSVQNSWQYADRLPNCKMSGDCAKPPKSLESVPNRDSGLGKSLSSSGPVYALLIDSQQADLARAGNKIWLY